MKKFLLSGLLVFGYQSALAADLQAAADDFCSCMKEPYAAMEKVMMDFAAAQAHGDYSELEAKQAEMMVVMDEASPCIEDLPKKYPEIDQDENLRAQAIALANEQCPSPMNRFRFGFPATNP